jgi:outer membrane protein assembly factor BamB
MSEIQDTSFGPTIARLTEDGNRCLIVAGATPDGTACLAAIDLTTSKCLWHQKFDRFSAGQRFWNSGGPLLWQSGQFTQRGRQDILITLARSNMHSEETFLLCGQTGTVKWNRDSQIADRGFGGQPFAIADFNGNGLDDLASFHPDICYIADGTTGKDLLAKQNYWDEVPLKPVYWGQPVAGRFDPNSQKESLLFTTHRRQMIGRVNADGSLAWSDAYDKAANGFPAIGDFDGDGSIDAMFIGFNDGIRCYDTATGRREWTLDLARQQDVGSAVSGDIDGDGKDEAIFVLDKVMYCVGTDKSGHSGLLKWELTLPTTASSPILADVTSTSKIERRESRLSVLVTGSDGYIYCIDSAANSVPSKADNAQR